jgi:hypothetical protein
MCILFHIDFISIKLFKFKKKYWCPRPGLDPCTCEAEARTSQV